MDLKKSLIENLLSTAAEASKNAYCPYSHFNVGAALLCDDGEIFTGVNVENRSYGLTICAERSAIVKAVSMGKQNFKALAIFCSKASYPVSPCGACRQFISEFADSSMPVIFSGKDSSNRIETTIGELFPFNALNELKKGTYN